MGPGLAKARALPLVVRRPAVLVRSVDPRWRELFERADSVSEGGVRDETAGRIWYGSTSLILPAAAAERDFLLALAARSAHVRLRAVRAARREACSRAPCGLGRAMCEIRFTGDARGLRIDVDVQAPLIEKRTRGRATRG